MIRKGGVAQGVSDMKEEMYISLGSKEWQMGTGREGYGKETQKHT